MTIPVQIEYGNHAIRAHLHAVPRVGEHISCTFPADGLPKLFLVVTRVYHHQAEDFTGKETNVPFRIDVITDDDPDFKQQNRDAIMRAARASG